MQGNVAYYSRRREIKPSGREENQEEDEWEKVERYRNILHKLGGGTWRCMNILAHISHFL